MSKIENPFRDYLPVIVKKHGMFVECESCGYRKGRTCLSTPRRENNLCVNWYDAETNRDINGYRHCPACDDFYLPDQFYTHSKICKACHDAKTRAKRRRGRPKAA